MELRDIVPQFLMENEEGLKNLLTWFLNIVMEHEALQQAGTDYYERTKTRKAHRNGYRKRYPNTRLHNLGKFLLKQKYLKDTPG